MIAFIIAAALQSATTCYNFGVIVRCDTTTTPSTSGPVDYTRGLGTLPHFDGNMALGQAARARNEARERGRLVGRMIAEGNCAGARRYALETDDFALVEAVKQNCE